MNLRCKRLVASESPIGAEPEYSCDAEIVGGCCEKGHEVPENDKPAPKKPCAWCPDFNPLDPANAGQSHTICEDCQRKMENRGGPR